MDYQREFLQAVKNGQLPKVSALCGNKAVDINKTDQDGLTAIDHSAFLGHKKITAFLLEQNALTSKKSPTGITVMHAAALGGNAGIVKLLLSYGVLLHTTTVDGITPLHYGSSNGKLDVVKILLENGANPSAATKHLCHTPLHKAASGGHEEVIKILLEHKSPVDARSSVSGTILVDMLAIDWAVWDISVLS